MSRQVTVLVVGAGPAGAVTAAALARQGVRTLLVDRATPARSDHDLLLSAPAWHSLRSIGVTASNQMRPVELWFDAGTRHLLPDAGFTVESRLSLEARLLAHAIESGAEYVRGTVESWDGHEAIIDGRQVVHAEHVVTAVGAVQQGRSAHGAGLSCARRFTGAVSSRIILRLLTPDDSDPRSQPACAWLAPGADGDYTVGVTVMGGTAASLEPARLLDDALAALGIAEPGRPLGPVISGPVNSGFSPDPDAGDLRVGDAAGLVNPFTGEGMSSAIQSGLIAARCIAAHIGDPAAARRIYARDLSATFVGYFETARHAARRYHLAWRVLAASAGSDSAFFVKGRRAILLPEGLSELAGAEPLALPSGVTPLLMPFLLACDEVAVTTVRHEWPFLARLLVTGAASTEYRIRPAVLLFAAILADGAIPAAGHASMGAAIELAFLGTMALLGSAAPTRRDRGVDWQSATCVLASDYLLSQASRLVAEFHPEISWAFADWLAELAALRAESLTTTGSAGARDVFAALFEFPLRIGAELGKVSPGTGQALRAYGTVLGHMFLHTEDILAVRGQRTRLDATLNALLTSKVSALPALLPDRVLTARTLQQDPDLRSAALTVTSKEARTAWHATHEATASVPNSVSRLILTKFAGTLGEPALPS
ncbi:flavin-dependent dehydrogenase [Kibdelosporangium banguiense]|uniref:Flavin-dependent dehydrogenase n=1 Tax=Kibdelosporangium banguiense TaxID=1365924 RepID=A0ABS4TM46_9PSEU|nr:NAD(P)/FAD-dependent oxidoreductase [Kibdelosporangium banguiense]MBP2325489.1 flavin-dependent dehydrogenase [Kibdelosporangium banguiense]